PVGRWALWGLSSEEAPSDEERTERFAWQLLRRYGVVFRDPLAREAQAPPWRVLLGVYRRLEDRGEIRGGRFVAGFIGEQFALPVAVESLRAARKQRPSTDVITVSAADPLNLVGIIVPGERVPAISGKHVAFRNGVAVEPEARWELTRLSAAGD